MVVGGTLVKMVARPVSGAGHSQEEPLDTLRPAILDGGRSQIVCRTQRILAIGKDAASLGEVTDRRIFFQ